MSTTAKYLQELVNQKNRLVDFLNSKGVEASKENTFNQLINSVETMSSGGIVELDELHKPVPNSGYVEKVYFNTNLSVDEVVKVLARLEYSDFLNSKMYGILYANEGSKQITLAVTKIEDYIYAIQDTLTGTPIFVSANYSGIDFIGWNPNLANVFEINSNVLNNVGSLLSVGEQNDLLVTLVSTTPFKKGEGVEGELYKLKATGTPVPESGLIEKVYINQYLDSVGMVNILKTLTYPNLPGFGEVYPFIVNSDMAKKVAVIVDRINGEITHYRIICDESSLWGYSLQENIGYWNSAEPIIELEVGYENAFSMLAPMFGVPSQNVLLKDLFSITPFEVKYYTIKDGKYVELTEGGSGGGSSEPTWEDVLSNKPKFSKTGYYYAATNGIDLYYSYSSSSTTGIYHKNLETGEENKIYNSGYYWQYFFEDSKGNVYAGSSYGDGIIQLNGTTVTNKYFTNYREWQFFYEDKKGNVYVSGRGSNCGLVNIKDGVANQIYTNSTNYWNRFVEDSKGNVYVSSASYAGLLFVDGINVNVLLETINNFNAFFEDGKGNLYVSSSNSSHLGLYLLNANSATQIYSTGYNYLYFFEDSKGNVYSSCYSSTGLFHLNGEEVTNIYDSGYGWQYFFEDSKGNVYVSSSNSSSSGIILSVGNTASNIYSTGYNYQYWFEDSKGNVYVNSATNSSSYKLLHLENGTITALLSLNKAPYYYEVNNVVYLTKEEKPIKKALIYIINNKTSETVYYVGE